MASDEAELAEPSREVADLIRAGVETVLNAPPEWIADMNHAAMHPAGMERVLVDADLREVALRINEGNLNHWARSNLADPGARVSVNLNEETIGFVRDLVRRGFDAGALDSFRTAQNTAWRLWMQICFGLTSDARLLRELLEVTSVSIATFIDDTVAELTHQIDVARAELAGDNHAQRRAAVALILEGAPIAPARADLALRYSIEGPQSAMVISGDAGLAPDDLEAACEAIMVASGVGRRLTVLAGASELWVWLPTDRLVVDAALAAHPHVRVTAGSPGAGREGFRRSHFEALEGQQLLTRLGSTARFAAYDDLALLAAMTRDLTRLDAFVAHTLGDLASADRGLHESVRMWFACQCNASAAAARLYTHRNTVVRHVARAQELLPRPLETNAVAVAAALEALRWRE
ncbi:MULTISPECIES: PucR family transcriptional regulator [Gordonia]|uniref:PucR family transcriptional regulator n=2 Tax=Gordonia TaxID=2053 RepID=A0ABP5UD99_9ACTN|nr:MULTISPECIES: helix-turn-helix domain-containing protein [Gordonia]AUH69543.1 PucR family transcriptional regulator [Gordonia sp. YC-JH1]KJR04015.1 transcriptional regulator [Gordonia sihwensis]KXT56661.1 transcriptional regulator [Gordonia sp. QH-12]MBY4569473.1 transcriptional regulator [Gordonia sihwensis]GAC61099.1 putative CdaR family transcriptional regulator [Gordonia sihwensis NBRC 108236]